MRNAIQNEIELYLLHRHVVFGPRERLTIAPSTILMNAIFNTVSGRIDIEDRVFFGHSVIVATGTHDYTQFGEARMSAHPDGGRDIRISQGVWIGSGAIIIGPVTIGMNAVVAAGAVVTKDVAPYTVVAGVPARCVRQITPQTQDLKS